MRKRFFLVMIILIALGFNCLVISNAEEKNDLEEQTNIEETKNQNNSIANNENQDEEKKPKIKYYSHVRSLGWEQEFSKENGQTSGTEGMSKSIEAIKIDTENLSENTKIKYQVHVQNIGWQEWKNNGEMAGTTGQALRIEAIRIKLENETKYSVKYRVHVQNIGWQNWKQDGAMAGTEGKSLRIEAIQIVIVDKEKKAEVVVEKGIQDKSYFDEINISGYKWSNVEKTGLKILIDNKDYKQNIDINYTERNDIINQVDYGSKEENEKPGFSAKIKVRELEAGKHNLKIIVYDPKNENKELATYSKDFNIDKDIHIKYKAHVQNVGWQDWSYDGEMEGTEGKKLRVEAIRLEGINLPEGVTLKYQVHIENIGWQDWVNEGEMAGTTGKALKIEAIRIKLENTDQYSIRYRAHVQDMGWQDWSNDGEMTGTQGISKRVEAFKVEIVNKITEKKTKVYLDRIGQVTNETHQVTGWIMTNEKNVKLRLFIDNTDISNQVSRYREQEIYNKVKGYGGEETNPMPRFKIQIDFSKYAVGNHVVKMQAISEDGKILQEMSRDVNIKKRIESYKGRYGTTGLGDGLEYFRYGNGPNVFFATFSVHGFEDNWNQDGYALVNIAHQFYNRLNEMNDYSIADKWTIYIMQCVNPDGVNYGNTNYGPGRTTLKSDIGHGIDLNRCWSTAFVPNYSNRNYTGSQPFLAQEARYLRDFMLAHKSATGQNVVVDLHGWTQQLIGDPVLRNYYRVQFPENTDTASYGKGYLINWARANIGARAALIELPKNNYSNSDVNNHNLVNRYIGATISMLRGL